MARVILTRGEAFTVLNSTADVEGSGGIERLLIAGNSSVTVSQTVERVDLAGNLAEYTFKMLGNAVQVFSGDTLVAKIRVQDDEDGSLVAFADGAAYLNYATSGNAIQLGNQVISKTAKVGITASQVGSFNTNIKSGSASLGGSTSAGQPFILTTGLNTFTGGSGNDTFDATVTNSLSLGDVLVGGDGTADSLTANLSNSAGSVNSTGVEVFTLTVAAAGAATLNMASATGLTTITNLGSQSALTLNNLASVPAVNINTIAVDTTLNFANAALAGTADDLQVSLDGVAAGANVILTRAAGATNALETVSLNSGSLANTLNDLQTTGVGATALKVTGDQNLTITADLDDEITTVAAGSASGALDFGVGTGNTTVTTGTGADNITGNIGNDNISTGAGHDTVDGGAGDDTINGGAGNDQITGGAGVDVLGGGDGDDTFLYANSLDLIATVGDDAAVDSIDGGLGNDVLSVGDTISIGAAGADSLARIVGVETLTQTAGAGSVIVLASDAALSNFRTINLAAATGANTVTLTGVTVGVSVTGSNDAATDDTITGGAGNDTLSGGLGQNAIAGAAGDDRITMSAGDENIDGGAGNDTIVGGANVDDLDAIAGGAGTDTLTLAGDITLTAANLISGIEVLALASEGDIAGANTGNQYVLAMDNDNDTDAAASTTDIITINASGLLADADSNTALEQAETINFNGATTTTHLYSVTGGAGADTLVGGDLADTLRGGAGADQLTGGAGTDSLDGGEGGDTYNYAAGEFVAADVVADTGTVGTDRVVIAAAAAVTDAMFANKTGLEAATLSSAQTYTLGANAQAAGITAVTVSGAAGTLVATDYTVGLTVTDAATAQVITTGSGADRVTLTAGANDSVNLGAGNDTLVGGAAITAADILTGGTGTDVLTLNGAATTIVFDGNFTLFEQITVVAGLAPVAVAGGADTAGTVNDYTLTLVNANVADASTFTVDASVLRAGAVTTLGNDAEIGGTAGNADIPGDENLNLDASGLTGTRAVSVIGGAAADTILGGAGADTLNGGAGADSLVGNAGADVISGGAGNDTITGGAGMDTISAGDGADTLIYAAVAESTGLAADTVSDFVSGTDKFAFTINVGGATAVKIDASTFAQVTSFNDGQLSLAGTSNALGLVYADGFYDTIADRIYIDANGDGQINEGNDYTVNVTNLVAGDVTYNITGSSVADTITGGSAADTITGGAGDDTITGGAGADDITAGAGADTIVLATAAAAADIIRGFVSTSDVLDLSGALTAATLTIGTQVAFDTTSKATTIASITTDADTDAPVYYIKNTAGDAEVLTLAEIEAAITAGSSATGEAVVLIDDGTDTRVYFDSAAQTDAGSGAGLILLATLVGVTGPTALATNDLISV